jgi:hypothetical protein
MFTPKVKVNSMLRFGTYLLSSLCLLALENYNLYGQDDEKKRKAYLEDILRLQDKPTSLDSFVNHRDKSWIDWQKRTGELPPDFDALPSIPFLPDLLTLDEGGKNIPITNSTQWKEQREYFEKQVKHIISGTFPPAPGNVVSRLLEQRIENGVKIELIELRIRQRAPGTVNHRSFYTTWCGSFPRFYDAMESQRLGASCCQKGIHGVDICRR